MQIDIVVGVTWLHRAGKLAHKDNGIEKEIDYIASIFRYFSNEQSKRHLQEQGEK